MKNLIRSMAFAMHGLRDAFRSEPNMRIHLAATICVLFAGFLFQLQAWEWTAVIVCIVLVFSVEMLNTSIEQIMNLLHPERDERVRKIKNISAGAVLVSAIGALITGLIIFLPRLFALLFG